MRSVQGSIRALQSMGDEELVSYSRDIGAPVELVRQTREMGRLPVVNFAAGGVATPADAALMMRLGADGVFVGSGIFKSEEPSRMANAIVRAVTHYQDDDVLAEVSTNLPKAMPGIEIAEIPEHELLAKRGW